MNHKHSKSVNENKTIKRKQLRFEVSSYPLFLEKWNIIKLKEIKKIKRKPIKENE